MYAIATVAIAHVTWKSTPQWIKNGILTGSTSPGDEFAAANDDLANPLTVWAKIKEVLNLAQSLSDDVLDEDMPQYKLYCCFMSMIHLMNEIDANDPEWREKYFSKEGEDVSEEELEVVSKYLDFAEWAYLTSQLELGKLLRPLEYDIVRFDNATEPGRVGHYIAVDHKKKEVVFAIKGTSTFSDVLTDIIGKAVPHELEGGKEIRCHEGMYVAARLLLQDTLHMIENFFAPQGYSLVVCGHSLGAGVSSLLGMFIKQHLPDLKLHVYAFATPACCSYQASIDCADYITSIVNNNDCVPRFSLMNIRMMKKMLALIDAKLDEKGLSPKDFSTARNYMSDLLKIDANLLVTPQELTDFLEGEISAPRSDRFTDLELYVPGRVISVWNHTNDAGIVGGKVTTGHSQVLRQVFVEANMISDHSCVSYRENLAQLMEQTANTI